MTTDVLELLWPPVEPAVGQLPLGQPPRESLLVDLVQLPEDRERRDAYPHCSTELSPIAHNTLRDKARTLTRVALRPDNSPEPTVEVSAPSDIAHGLLNIKFVQMAEQRERVHCDV